MFLFGAFLLDLEEYWRIRFRVDAILTWEQIGGCTVDQFIDHIQWSYSIEGSDLGLARVC